MDEITRSECQRIHTTLDQRNAAMDEKLDSIKTDISALKTAQGSWVSRSLERSKATEDSINNLADNLTQWREAINKEINARFTDEKIEREKVSGALEKHVEGHWSFIAVIGGIILIISTLFVVVDRSLPSHHNSNVTAATNK